MTVRELIEKLQTVPPDAVVMMTKYSDYRLMDWDDDFELLVPGQEGLVWCRKPPDPEFITALHIRGN